MTASYLFDSDGLRVLAGYVSPETLFAFSLDGILTHVDGNVSISNVIGQVQSTLQKLNSLAKVVIISGRSRKQALADLSFEPNLLIGNYGNEWPTQEGSRNWQQVVLCLKWQDQLHAMISYTDGIDIEFRGESIAINYSKAKDPDIAVAGIDVSIKKLVPEPTVIAGKFEIHILPPGSKTKGKALKMALKVFGLKRAIYLGNDVTDDDVFSLKDVDVFSIHVGDNRQTPAPYYLKKPATLLGLLNSMVGILESHSEIVNEI